MDGIGVILFLIIAFMTGSTIEKNHYKKIRAREVKYFKKPCISFAKNVIDEDKVEKTELVCASVVIACDYFKFFISTLKSIFGGNISSYESVLDRGRREAILRMKEKAYENGLDAIVNVKIETIMLDPVTEPTREAQKMCITVYGTAIKYAK